MKKIKNIIAILMTLSIARGIGTFQARAWDYSSVCMDSKNAIESINDTFVIVQDLSRQLPARLNSFMRGLALVINELSSPARNGNSPEFQDLLLNAYNYLNNLREYLMGSEFGNLNVLGRNTINSVSSFIYNCVTPDELGEYVFFRNPRMFDHPKGMVPSQRKDLKFRYANSVILFKLHMLSFHIKYGIEYPKTLLLPEQLYLEPPPDPQGFSIPFIVRNVIDSVNSLIGYVKGYGKVTWNKAYSSLLRAASNGYGPSDLEYVFKKVYSLLDVVYKYNKTGDISDQVLYPKPLLHPPGLGNGSKNLFALANEIKGLVKSIKEL